MSSHNNFIQEGLVDKLGLLSDPAPKFHVYMGNGQFLLCDRMCMNLSLVIQGHKFMVHLHVLPMCGLDTVLGMQWLRTLGPCIHDHEALTMEFTWKNKQVYLLGNLSQNRANCLTINFVPCSTLNLLVASILFKQLIPQWP